MLRTVRSAAAIGLVALLGACAHPISIAPNLTSIPTRKPSVQKNAVYVIAQEDRAREVTNATGGGDSITYYPYKELEAGIFHVLSSVYAKVTLLRSSADKAGLDASKASFVFLPTIATESSSPGSIFWPPTNFAVTIKYQVQDAAGKTIYSNQIEGKGTATYDEFRKELGLAGRLASEDALKKFKDQVGKAQELK